MDRLKCLNGFPIPKITNIKRTIKEQSYNYNVEDEEFKQVKNLNYNRVKPNIIIFRNEL